MDEAFTRRVRFAVEFPFPDEAGCLRIWKTHFPADAPVSPGIDYQFLARELRLPGGNIKNIVLSAAFMAAENGDAVNMQHILHGSRREYEKMVTLAGTLARAGAVALTWHLNQDEVSYDPHTRRKDERTRAGQPAKGLGIEPV